MAFIAKVINQNDTDVRWSFSIDLQGVIVPLATTASIPLRLEDGNLLPALWPDIYRKDQANVFALDEIDNYSAIVITIVTRLEQLYAGGTLEQQVALQQIFADGFLEKPSGYSGLVSDVVVERVREEEAQQPYLARIRPEEVAALYMVLFKALARFLQREDRFAEWDARLAYLYTTWQWYGLGKRLSMLLYADYQERTRAARSDFDRIELETDPYVMLRGEVAEGFQVLTRLLDTPPEFAQAISWLGSWTGLDTLQEGISILRENMRTSLPIIPDGWMADDMQRFSDDAIKPIQMPFWEQSEQRNPRQPIWRRAVLHPSFQERRGRETDGRRAIRKLTGEWLLPRYNFDDALQFARLMRKNMVEHRRFGVGWLGVASWLFFLLVSLVSLAAHQMWGENQLSQILRDYGTTVEWAAIACFIIIVYASIDSTFLPYFLMPRVAGGVTVGYLALILSEDSYRLMNFFINHNNPLATKMMIAVLWFTVLGLGLAYLYFDTLPFVGIRKRGLALRRAGQALSVAMALSLFIGLFFLPIATQMYFEDYIESNIRLVILGPIGWVDWQTFAIFVPIALFAGLVTQFIFEEKTVTTSIWAPELE